MKKVVYRYMPVHRLWQMLSTGKLFFLRNTKWDDPFEAYLVKRYCKASGRDFDLINSSRYFLCCTTKPERDHFWRNYTPNKDGVMVTFDLDVLRSQHSRIRGLKVTYPKYDKIKTLLRKIDHGLLSQSHLTDLYFIKRLAFEDEKEFRFLIENKRHVDDTIGIDFEPERTITRILFDPRMDGDTFERHKLFINKQFGPFKVEHSQLYHPDKSFPKREPLIGKEGQRIPSPNIARKSGSRQAASGGYK